MESALPRHIERFLAERTAEGPFEERQTHASWVFIGRDRVYKFKKPVDFGFLDYASLETRRRMCAEELRLNARLAPDVYLEVVGVDADGQSGGAHVDYALVMRRLPEERMLDHALRDGSTTIETAADLGRRLAAFHRTAQVGTERGLAALERMIENWRGNFERVARMPEALPPPLVEQVRAYFETFRRQHDGLLRTRHARWTVEGHGDLRAEHVCLTDPPVFFDCLEFDESLRTVDAASDLAFLLMDLEAQGERAFAGALCAAYAYETRDETLGAVLDFYRCYRAFIRAMVEGLRSEAAEVPAEERDEARRRALRMLVLSRHYARPARLVIVHGYSATGKSTVAARIAVSAGAALIATDVVRKELLGLEPAAPLEAPGFRQGAFNPDATREAYAEVTRRALGYLFDGVSVVLDGTFLYPEGREAAAALRQAWPGPTVAVLVDPGERRLRANLERRRLRPDASLAGLEAYEQQRRDEPDPALAQFWTLSLDEAGCDLPGDEILARLPAEFAPLPERGWQGGAR
jgi:aminoglycoside phosphotransferase family enzyme/predicted kinase